MSAPGSGMEAAEQPAADALLEAFKTIDAAERQKHEAVLNYWLSIRGNRELPPLRDLDPLEISDAAPSSVLLELLGGGEDAEVRHLGEQLKSGADVDRISEAPRPSILASIARKLSIVAVSRNFLAFEDDLSANGEKTRCWVTMLPLSSAGAWVDYVYAFVSFGPADEAKEAESVEIEPESAEIAETLEIELESAEIAEPVEEAKLPEPVEDEAEIAEVEIEDIDAPAEDVLELDSPIGKSAEPEPESKEPVTGKKGSSFSFDAAVGGFYATKAVNVKPTLPEGAPAKARSVAAVDEEPAPPAAEEISPLPKAEAAPPAKENAKAAADEKPHKAISATEGSLHSKLTEVRAKADEARMAKLRANAAFYEGLSAAYDFALDAEDSPEEYLRIVEAQGLKIQLRSPMRPVVKLAFDGMCDDSMIAQLEAVLAWAIEQELPRGSLAKHIEEAGGIGPILSGLAKAA